MTSARSLAREATIHATTRLTSKKEKDESKQQVRDLASTAFYRLFLVSDFHLLQSSSRWARGIETAYSTSARKSASVLHHGRTKRVAGYVTRKARPIPFYCCLDKLFSPMARCRAMPSYPANPFPEAWPVLTVVCLHCRVQVFCKGMPISCMLAVDATMVTYTL